MPKMKTKSAAKKRFKVTATGKIKRACSGKNHILTKKDRKRKNNLCQGAYVDATQQKTIQTLIYNKQYKGERKCVLKEQLTLLKSVEKY